jgi:hypothetical protein
MSEGMSVEVAHKPSEPDQAETAKTRWDVVVEIVEVIVLAIVAIATAWSGYQATRWDGRQSVLYGQASSLRLQANAASTLGGQKLSADASMFTAYVQARSAADQQLQDSYVRRFSPEYRTAFLAWLTLDPFTNPAAPPGPGYMPEYHNPDFATAAQLNQRASAMFNQGTQALESADHYVRDTVLFASVLFLVAIAQRFRLRGVRFATTTLAFVLLAYTTYAVVSLPRA